MNVPSLLPAIAVGVSSTVAVYLVLRPVLKVDRRMLQRIRDLEVIPADRPGGSETHAVTNQSWFSRLFSPSEAKSHEELRSRLSHAGFSGALAVPTFVLTQLIAAMACGGLAVCSAKWIAPRFEALLPALIGLCSGFLTPSFAIRQLSLRRHQAIERAIPDMLDLLVACLDAGLSLEGAMQKITEEIRSAHPLLGREMRRVQTDIDLGAPADRALQGFAERTNVDVLRTLATACSQARRYGSKLTQTLRTLAESLRQHREQRAEEAAQAAAVKILFPTLILLFPIIFIVLAGPAAIQIAEQFGQGG